MVPPVLGPAQRRLVSAQARGALGEIEATPVIAQRHEEAHELAARRREAVRTVFLLGDADLRRRPVEVGLELAVDGRVGAGPQREAALHLAYGRVDREFEVLRLA